MEKRKAHFLNWVDTMWDVDGRCRTEVPSRKGNEVKGNLVGIPQIYIASSSVRQITRDIVKGGAIY